MKMTKLIFSLLMLLCSFFYAYGSEYKLLQAISGRRNLQSAGTVQILNSLINDFTLEITLSPQIKQTIGLETIETIGALHCDSFGIENLTFVVNNLHPVQNIDGVNFEEFATNLTVIKILFSCSVQTKTTTSTIFGSPIISFGSVSVGSTKTNVSLLPNFYSIDLGYIIPTEAIVNENVACNNLIRLGLTYDFDIGGIAGGLISLFQPALESAVDSAIKSALCTAMDSINSNITDLVENNALVKDPLFTERTVPSGNVADLVLVAESELETSFTNGIDFISSENLENILENLALNLITTDFFKDFISALSEIATTSNNLAHGYEYEYEAYSKIINNLETIIYLLTEHQIDINLELVIELTDDLVAFIQSIDLSTEYLLENFDFESLAIFIQEEFDKIIDAYPNTFDEYQATKVVNQIAEFIKSDQFKQIFNIILSNLDSIFATRSSIVRRILQVPGLNVTSGMDAITEFFGFLNTFTLQEIINLIPSDVINLDSLETIIDFFGANSTITDVISYVNSTFFGLFDVDIITGELVLDLDFSKQLSDDIKNLLNLTSILFPELSTILSPIFNDPDITILELIQDDLTFSLNLSTLGNATISFNDLSIKIKGEILSSDGSGPAGQASFVLPRLDFNQSEITVGLNVIIVSKNNDIFKDVLIIQAKLDLFSQMAITFLMDTDQINDFSFENTYFLEDVLLATGNYLACSASSILFGATAQNTTSDVDFNFHSKNGTFAGFAEDFINNLVYLYIPALPTYLENNLKSVTIKSLDGFTSLFGLILSEDNKSILDKTCLYKNKPIDGRNPTSAPTPVDTSGGSSKGEILGLDATTFYSVVGAIGLLGLSVIVFAITKASFGTASSAIGGNVTEAKVVDSNGKPISEAKVVEEKEISV